MPLTWTLGLAGLLPMAGGLLAPLFPATEAARSAALLYGVVISAFMAGTHWGLALHAPSGQAREPRLAVSIVPALLAWGAAFLAPRLGALALVGRFGLLFAIDARLAACGLHDPDHWRLRRIPSASAALCSSGIALTP